MVNKLFLYGLNIYSFAFMIPWGFVYWLFYDWTLGLLLTGNIFHVGTTGIDKYLISIFQDGVQYSFMKAIMALLTWSGVNYFYTL